jgi:hypothetical protein
MLYMFVETGIPFCLSYSIVCLGVSGHVIATVCLMVCVKDGYLIKVSFLKYSGLLDYLVYCFPPECIGWKIKYCGDD